MCFRVKMLTSNKMNDSVIQLLAKVVIWIKKALKYRAMFLFFDLFQMKIELNVCQMKRVGIQ